MLYTVAIPAKFAAEFAAGSVTLMTTSAGLNTTLVGASGIVGTATLVEASAAGAGTAGASAAASTSGAAAATAGGVALGPILLAVGAVAVIGLGIYLWHRHRKNESAQEETVVLTFDCEPADADAVLAEVHSIVEAAAARLSAQDPAA